MRLASVPILVLENLVVKSFFINYWSNWRTDCGIKFACPTIAVAACTRI
ncbi:uncharacterized protein METZ01_LOCUS450066, partial [marine metagenome]